MTPNFEDAFENHFPTPGVYQGKIIDVEDDEDYERIILSVDIDEGRFRNFWQTRNQNTDQAPKFFRYFQSYKPKARLHFKNLLAELEDTNPEFSSEDFRQAGSDGTSDCLEELKGLKIPILLDTVEYQSPTGIRSVLSIKEVFPERQ